MATQLDLSPDGKEALEVRLRQVVDWWNDLRLGDDPGATTWEVLENLEREVTQCLERRPRDLNKAESLTAYAMLLIAGLTEL